MDAQSEEELGYEMQSLNHESQREQMLSELQEGNRNLQERIKELEAEKQTEVKHPIDSEGKINNKHSYCYACGAGLKDQKYCHNCGRKLLWPT